MIHVLRELLLLLRQKRRHPHITTTTTITVLYRVQPPPPSTTTNYQHLSQRINWWRYKSSDLNLLINGIRRMIKLLSLMRILYYTIPMIWKDLYRNTAHHIDRIVHYIDAQYKNIMHDLPYDHFTNGHLKYVLP